jgi:hypothetical protein
MKSKTCTCCKKTKKYSEFTKRSHNKSGIAAHCKECAREKAKRWYSENKERSNESSMEWKKNNPEQVKQYAQDWRDSNKEHVSQYNFEYAANNTDNARAYREENKEIIAARNKKYRQDKKEFLKIAANAWHEAHPDYKNESLKKWRAANPEKNKAALKRANDKRAKNPKYKISASMSNGMRGSIKSGTKANRHWEELVDFTVEQLRTHLEKLFEPGMTWDNHGTVWEIDHKIPIAVFNFERPEHLDFRLCWSLKNLQPLEKIKNRKKSDKIDKPFQPCLPLAMVG